jgi:glycosyltransferase involved in cell wall biosynthesis
MKKDILFLCQFFYPETVSSATLPFDTASFLADAGYTVGALCGFPKEYTNDHSTPLKEEKNGVEIKRMKYIQLSRVGSIGRLINYFSFTVKALLNIGKLKNYKSVIVYSNPPVLPIIPILAKKIYGTKLVFVAYDIYPEIAYASKSIVSGSFLDKVMKKINDHLYKNSDAVVSLTTEMKQFLLNNRKGLESDRVFVIENWAHEKETTVLKDETYEKFGFKKNQFIVGYFGNLGTCQDVDTILDTALRMKNDNRFGFLIVGHGNKKEKVKEFIEKNNLENIKIFDYLVGDDFKQAVAMANCSIVSLEKGLKGTCAPSI